ncbi:hypothetical protein TCAL_12635 [Tigriopus californicus]|uniref:Ig-like domain-containing protein n=1 Tax=Tigriopus californicus TaxID=6832 RepID=A0A553P8J1_TIGCA|nr:hypothetical protein TCAL_12635 [Tigriopus californicus]
MCLHPWQFVRFQPIECQRDALLIDMPALKELTKPNKPSLELVQDGVHIQLHSEKNIRTGSNFQLLCNVTKDVSRIQVSWKRNGIELNPKEREKNGKSPLGPYTYSVLDVTNATKLDQGNYTCQVKNSVAQTNDASIWLNIVDKVECQIGHVTTAFQYYSASTSSDVCVPIDVRAGDVASLVVKIDYSPGTHHEIMWLTAQQETHSSDEYLKPRGGRTKYSFHHPTPSNHSALLNIYNVSIWDHGRISFFCPNDVQDQIHFCLNVQDVPKVELKAKDHAMFQATPTLYSIGNTYEFHCSMTGNPKVEQVQWKVCWNHQSDCETEIFTAGSNNNTFRSVPNGHELEMESFRSAFINASSANIECLACSKNICGNSSKLIIEPIDYYPPKMEIFGVCVSSMKDGHCTIIEELANKARIERYKTQPLHIVCGLWIESQERDLALAFDFLSDVDTFESKTEFSIQSHMLFESLDFEHSGSVSCLGKKLFIHIKNISIPIPINGSFNMNEEDLVATWNKNQQASLQCAMSGTPEPEIFWFKMAETGQIAVTHQGAILYFHELRPEDAGVYTSSDVNYATLEIHDNTKTLDDEDDKISPLPLRQKKVSNVSRHSFDDTCFTSDSPNIKERRPKVSIISTDSEFDNIGNTTDMTCVSGVSPRNRIHKISIQSTDSEFDHIENATDMTILSNRQQNLIQDEFSQPKETRESIATKHYLILNKPFEEENELRQTKYVYLQHIPTKADSKSDEGPSETCPMLPQPSLTIPREPEMSTPIDQGFAFFNPTYSQIKKPHPASRPIIGQKRQASSRSLLACKVSESDGIQPFHSQNHLNLSKYAKVDLTPTAEVELQIVQHHSSSSLSSGFHSNSSDVLKSSLHKRHLDRPHAEKRRDIDPKLDLLDKPVASFNGAANMIN